MLRAAVRVLRRYKPSKKAIEFVRDGFTGITEKVYERIPEFISSREKKQKEKLELAAEATKKAEVEETKLSEGKDDADETGRKEGKDLQTKLDEAFPAHYATVAEKHV